MIKRASVSLRNRVATFLVMFAAAIAVFVAFLGHLANEQLEETLLRSTLEAELSYYLKDRQAHPAASPPKTADLATYIWRRDGAKPISLPPEIAGLGPGIYEEIGFGGREYCVLVRDVKGERIFMSYDITRLEESEQEFAMIAALLAVLAAIAIVVVSHLLAHHLVKSVRDLAERVTALDPAKRGAHVGRSFREREVTVIADAIDRYLRRMDGVMESEQEFVDTASHELRTPIAIVSGAVDVLRSHPHLPNTAQPVIQRLHQAAHDMNETVTALFYLAKDPDYLAALAEPLQLDEKIHHVMQANAVLAKQKHLDVRLSLEETIIHAPAGAVKTVINNLIRNAIVHTEQGRVSIDLHAGVLTVTNTSTTIAPEELASIFMKRVRGSGTVHSEGAGLGLYIIKRICERLGWDLGLTSDSERGTVVRIDVRAHVVGGPKTRGL